MTDIHRRQRNAYVYCLCTFGCLLFWIALGFAAVAMWG